MKLSVLTIFIQVGLFYAFTCLLFLAVLELVVTIFCGIITFKTGFVLLTRYVVYKIFLLLICLDIYYIFIVDAFRYIIFLGVTLLSAGYTVVTIFGFLFAVQGTRQSKFPCYQRTSTATSSASLMLGWVCTYCVQPVLWCRILT